MQIRCANSADLNTLVILDKISNITNWSLNDYQNSFNNKQHFIYILEEHGKISACIVFGVVCDEAEILQLWVENNSKRKGLGIYILNYTLIELRKKHMILRVFLEVRDGNESAINLYKKAGFLEVGRRHKYYNIDAWQFDALIMQKEFLGF
jgi:ribosomal protein S18 acetylase RimI-like enzyme